MDYLTHAEQQHLEVWIEDRVAIVLTGADKSFCATAGKYAQCRIAKIMCSGIMPGVAD